MQRGIAVADRAKNAKLEAEARRLDMETQYLPKMFEDEGAPAGSQAPQEASLDTRHQQGGCNMGSA